MKCLGLDLGSSSIKGAVLDLASGRVEGITREPFPDPLPGLPPRHFEVLLEPILVAVRSVLRRLGDVEPAARGVFCCGQMGGVVLTDPSGQPLTNYLSWRDQRSLDPHPSGGSYLDVIQHRWSAGELAELGELKPGSATSLLFWLAEQGRLPGAAVPLSLGDFVVAQLCGARPRMEPTQAVGLLDLTTGTWHRRAFARLGIDKLDWPPLAEVAVPIGQLVLAGRPVPLFPVLGDQQCALFGARLEEDELSLNISTGSQVSQVTRRLRLGAYQTRPYLGGWFLNTITHLPAGRSLNALVDLLSELSRAQGMSLANPWPYIARVAAEADGGGLDCSLTYFAGPMGDTGRIDGMTVDNLTIGNLFRAAFRSMAENYAVCAERLCPSRSWRRLVLSGGLTQSVLVLKQLIEQRFAAPVRECPAGEDTLTGLLEIARTVLMPTAPGGKERLP